MPYSINKPNELLSVFLANNASYITKPCYETHVNNFSSQAKLDASGNTTKTGSLHFFNSILLDNQFYSPVSIKKQLYWFMNLSN